MDWLLNKLLFIWTYTFKFTNPQLNSVILDLGSVILDLDVLFIDKGRGI